MVIAQTWLELRESGANYKEIKAAFLKQYKNKLSKFKRESGAETGQTLSKINEKGRPGRKNKHNDDDFEKEMEGIVHFCVGQQKLNRVFPNLMAI